MRLLRNLKRKLQINLRTPLKYKMSNKLYQQHLQKEDQNPNNFMNKTALFLSSYSIHSDQNKIFFENKKNLNQTPKSLKKNMDIFEEDYFKMFMQKKNVLISEKIEGKSNNIKTFKNISLIKISTKNPKFTWNFLKT